MSNVLRVSDAASLGLHAVALLATSTDRLLSTGEMAATLRASEAHLSKVLQRLAHLGFVRATRGPGGGFELARDAGEITLLDIYEAVEGPLRPSDCLLVTSLCGGHNCIFGDLLTRLDSEVRRHLAGTTVAAAAKRIQGKTLL